MENDRPFPEDLLQMVMRTFALMHAPMVRLLPDKDPVEVALTARMMFSAVHGIISLGLDQSSFLYPVWQAAVAVRLAMALRRRRLS